MAMSKNPLTGKRGVTSLTYDMYKQVVYADNTKFNDIIGLYFDGDVEIDSGTANYEAGKVEIDFTHPVNVKAVKESEGIILYINQPVKGVRKRKTMLEMVAKWRPRKILSKFIKWYEWDEEEEEEELHHVVTVEYDAFTGEASAYGGESDTFSDIIIIYFESVGDGSKIRPDWLKLEARSGYEFTVTHDGPVIEVWEESVKGEEE
jgi:hypothetical protein